jgi:Uma2 family endonuclease
VNEVEMLRSRPFAPDTPDQVRLDDGTTRQVPDTMTLDEFMAFPWPQNQRWELLWGSPIMSPAPIPFHQDLVATFIVWMSQQLAGMPDYKLLHDEDVLLPNRENYVRPDIMVIRRDEVDMARVPVRALPALIVEVSSPSNAGYDWGDKKVAYAEAGVREYWITDPATCALAVHVLAGGEYRQEHIDGEGFVASEFFTCRLKVEFSGQDYAVRHARQ